MPQTITSIPVFFCDRMVAESGSRSPSSAKPPLVLADWQSHRLPVSIRDLEAVDEATLALAHDRDFVRAVMACGIDNGFGNRRPDVAASLPYTSGAMLAAAKEAIVNRRVACAPVSGFHHAGCDRAAAFCTFNGLMVTAMALRRDGHARRVGILDLDHHWGDGTDDIIRRLNTRWVQHHSSGRQTPGPSDAEPYLGRLATLVSTFMDCDVLLYQAGADAHVEDPLGGWMTSEQLALRDRIVFSTAAKLGLPVAWNLAGGYQVDADGGIAPVLAIHRQTMWACAAVYADA